ncbi:hypothetical protein BDW74DRAFT_175319 [Aspergillus multicolor]|uniref:uncharacterized protein n=1 Tax=Aspergillus multicolor TaxID=41759 RepID=UPI003CCE37EF
MPKPIPPPIPKRPCTIYETMCPHCKHAFYILRELAVEGEDLEWDPNTSTTPVIFTFEMTLDLGLDARKVYVEHGESAVNTMRAKMLETYKKVVAIHGSFSSRTVRGETHVRQSYLFDFPWKVNGTKAWQTFLAKHVHVEVYEKEDTFRPKAMVSPEPAMWDVVMPTEQEEKHLCWWRLKWFLEREGIGAFI